MANKQRITGKRIFWALLAALAVAAFAFVMRPEPVWVDLATVERGPMEVTLLEEGKTRVKDRYLISSPVTGYLHRPQLHLSLIHISEPTRPY